MAKFVKAILFLLFVVVSFGAANSISAKKVVDETVYAMIHTNIPTQEFVSSAEMPYLPDAELAGAGMVHTNQVTMSRIQRINLNEYFLSLKTITEGVAGREDALAQYLSRLYDTTTSYTCHPASEYYVFALRRIIV